MIYAIIFSFVCFLLSSLGASSIFFMKNINGNLEAVLHAFSGGVMVSASIFSLIVPALDYCEELKLPEFYILPICFTMAFFTTILLDHFTNKNTSSKINIYSLNVGIALHNIPEGMCVGFAFASACVFNTSASFAQAVMIAIGIGLQNIPEGSSVALPLYSLGYSKKKAFFTSALVAFVEVPAGIIAFLIGLNYVFLLPYMLSFSAGIMLIVAICNLMPEAISKNAKLANVSFFIGFLIMTILDLTLGWFFNFLFEFLS